MTAVRLTEREATASKHRGGVANENKGLHEKNSVSIDYLRLGALIVRSVTQLIVTRNFCLHFGL